MLMVGLALSFVGFGLLVDGLLLWWIEKRPPKPTTYHGRHAKEVE